MDEVDVFEIVYELKHIDQTVDLIVTILDQIKKYRYCKVRVVVKSEIEENDTNE